MEIRNLEKWKESMKKDTRVYLIIYATVALFVIPLMIAYYIGIVDDKLVHLINFILLELIAMLMIGFKMKVLYDAKFRLAHDIEKGKIQKVSVLSFDGDSFCKLNVIYSDGSKKNVEQRCKFLANAVEVYFDAETGTVILPLQIVSINITAGIS